ncbi:MAG TPA: hypothetical protein VF469_06255 [Kofleriaceae bacterium]
MSRRDDLDLDVMRRRSRDVVRVRVPADQASLFHVDGPHGGWFISVLYGHRSSVDVPMRELRKMLAGSRGAVIIGRRLTREEAEELERRRVDCDAAVHAGIIAKEEERFRRPGRGGKHAGERGHAGQR